jgi:hypothetical protein
MVGFVTQISPLCLVSMPAELEFKVLGLTFYQELTLFLVEGQ